MEQQPLLRVRADVGFQNLRVSGRIARDFDLRVGIGDPIQRRLNLDHRIPLHREGTPEQVAELILTLVKNDYITGETMTIDGGLTMRIA